MAWLNVVLPSIKLKHPHRQTPGAAEWPRLLQSSQGLNGITRRPLKVLRGVNGWRSVDSVNLHNIARSGHEKPLQSPLELSELFRHCRRTTISVFHRVLTFQLFRHA